MIIKATERRGGKTLWAIQKAAETGLPLIVHSRLKRDEVMETATKMNCNLSGVFIADSNLIDARIYSAVVDDLDIIGLNKIRMLNRVVIAYATMDVKHIAL